MEWLHDFDPDIVQLRQRNLGAPNKADGTHGDGLVFDQPDQETEMTRSKTKSMLIAALGASVALVAGAACAGEPPPPPPPPPSDVICHNIGGPRDLGANCENTGNCSVDLVGGGSIVFTDAKQFLGILIGAGDRSAAAHIAHGDGFAELIFDPPLHLASGIGPHRASNVECMGTRVFPQAPEPGN